MHRRLIPSIFAISPIAFAISPIALPSNLSQNITAKSHNTPQKTTTITQNTIQNTTQNTTQKSQNYVSVPLSLYDFKEFKSYKLIESKSKTENLTVSKSKTENLTLEDLEYYNMPDNIKENFEILNYFFQNLFYSSVKINYTQTQAVDIIKKMQRIYIPLNNIKFLSCDEFIKSKNDDNHFKKKHPQLIDYLTQYQKTGNVIIDKEISECFEDIEFLLKIEIPIEKIFVLRPKVLSDYPFGNVIQHGLDLSAFAICCGGIYVICVFMDGLSQMNYSGRR